MIFFANFKCKITNKYNAKTHSKHTFLKIGWESGKQVRMIRKTEDAIENLDSQ